MLENVVLFVIVGVGGFVGLGWYDVVIFVN